MHKLRTAAVFSGVLALASLGAIGMGRATAASHTAGATADAQTYKIDPVHTTALFRIRHGAGIFWGRFNTVQGTMFINADEPTESFFNVTIPIVSVDTGNDQRDTHLKSGDFFNARQYPEAKFKSTSIVKADQENVYKVTGDLELAGQTHPITAHVLFGGEGEFQGAKTQGFEAQFEIKRGDWGMTTFLAPDGSDSGGVGNTVRVIVAGEGRKQ